MERIDITAFEPATNEQLNKLAQLAKTLGYKLIESSLTRCEAASAIAIWSSRLADKASK